MNNNVKFSNVSVKYIFILFLNYKLLDIKFFKLILELVYLIKIKLIVKLILDIILIVLFVCIFVYLISYFINIDVIMIIGIVI